MFTYPQFHAIPKVKVRVSVRATIMDRFRVRVSVKFSFIYTVIGSRKLHLSHPKTHRGRGIGWARAKPCPPVAALD